MKLDGAAKQSGMSAFDRYLAPYKKYLSDAVYLFPSVNDENKSNEVEIREYSTSLKMNFSPVRRRFRPQHSHPLTIRSQPSNPLDVFRSGCLRRKRR